MATAKSAPKKATTPRRKPASKAESVQTPVEEKVQTPPTSCHNGPEMKEIKAEDLPPAFKAFIEKMSERAHQESPEGKVEHILHVLKGSSATEVRHIMEDVGTALIRKAEDKQRKAERKLDEMRKDHSRY